MIKTVKMDCDSCENSKRMADSIIEKNHQLTLQVIDKDETIRALRAEVQTIGAKYRDMLWQRNTLHDIAMSEERTIRYRQITNEWLYLLR